MAVRPSPPDAGVLFAGGPILTMAAPLRVEALAVRGDRIVAAGTLADCREVLGDGAHEVDLAGRCLMPGFVDAHCHPLMLAQTDGWLDASPEAAPTIEALVDLLRARAAELPAGVPLRAYGHDYRRIPEFRHPMATDLDRAANDREIYVMNVSGHGGVLNTFGLGVHGITSSTADIDGGHIGRGPDGSPDGLVWDAACDLLTGEDGVKVGRHGPNIHLPESPARLMRLLDDAQAAFLRAGVTTVVDAQVTRREMATYLRARAGGRLRVRIEMLVLSSLLDEVLAMGIVERLGDDRCAVAGIKLYADGALGAGTAWFPEGYPGQPHAARAAVSRTRGVPDVGAPGAHGRPADGHACPVTRCYRDGVGRDLLGPAVGPPWRCAPPHRALWSADRRADRADGTAESGARRAAGTSRGLR